MKICGNVVISNLTNYVFTYFKTDLENDLNEWIKEKYKERRIK